MIMLLLMLQLLSIHSIQANKYFTRQNLPKLFMLFNYDNYLLNSVQF